MNLSNEIESLIDPADRMQSIKLTGGVLELYLGNSADRLAQSGFLNFVIRRQSGAISACLIGSIKRTKLTVMSQEGLKEPNASVVMNVRREDSVIYAQHWDGFLSAFDSDSLSLLSQAFTK